MDLLSINMSINNGDVERRYADLSEYTLGHRPDVLLVQEVSIDIGQTALRGLGIQLGDDYSLHYEPVYPGQEDEQGMAVLSSVPVIKSDMTDFLAKGNQAQIVTLDTGRETLQAANVHLEVQPIHHKSKMQELVDDKMDIIAGDLSALPFSPTVRMIKKAYESAYKTVNGREPNFTFPNLSADSLIAGGYLKESEIHVLKKVSRFLYPFIAEKHEIPRYTTDYVFIAKGILRATKAELVRQKARHTPFLSDHAGLRIQADIL